MDYMKEFIKALENDVAYDFIANNYWTMDRTDLKNILLEYIFYADDEAQENVLESLKEREEE